MNDWQLEFKAWYDEHYGGKQQTEFVRDSGLARSTWKAYLLHPVDLSKVSIKTKTSLYKLTGLDCFKVESVVENSDVKQSDLVKQTVIAFYELAQKLENFKVSPELREQLTERLPKMDVGRLTALLHAVYKPKDDFDQWLMISGYVYQGARK
ncbi:MAG: hypothetical protein NTW67_06405 [Candidatus Woesearchaeota archaeon]|nr:hypothetical protein [Candidatus Woesearchaeota archaeon]